MREKIKPLAAEVFGTNEGWIERVMGSQYADYTATRQRAMLELQLTGSLPGVLAGRVLGHEGFASEPHPAFDKMIAMMSPHKSNMQSQASQLLSALHDTDTIAEELARHLPAEGAQQ